MSPDISKQISEKSVNIFCKKILSEKYTPSNIMKGCRWDLLLIIYSLFLMTILFITRCFNNNFWCDECYTILLSEYDLITMIERESWDMSPPLYHIIFFVFCRLFGSTPFVYHLVSYVAYVLAIIFTITVLKNKYGTGFALIMVTFLSLLLSSLEYVQDARMYEWGMLFVLCSFTSAISVIQNNRTRNYVYLTVSIVLCAYTHYYCLLAASTIFLYLIIWAIRTKDKSIMKKILISAAVAIFLYLPWIANFISVFFDGAINGKTSTTFYISFPRSILYLFEGSTITVLFFVAILMGLIFYYTRKIGLPFKPKTEKKIDKIVSFFNLESADWKCLSLGMIVIFVSILLPTAFSYIVQPILELRYLFPVSVIAWFLVAFCASKCRTKMIATIAVLLVTLLAAIPLATITIIDDYHTDEVIKETLDLTNPYMTDNDVILSNDHALVWSGFDYYYPGIESQYLTTDYLPELDETRQYWLFLSSPIDDDMKWDIWNKGYGYSIITENGNIGSYHVCVYELIK